MLNEVVLSGRLTADPELKTTPTGVFVTSFTIANDVGYGDKKKTNFINIIAWRGTAEFITKYFKKGNMIVIKKSEIQTRKYQDKNGNNRTAFEVVAKEVEFFEMKKDDAGSEATPVNYDTSNFVEYDDGDDLPF